MLDGNTAEESNLMSEAFTVDERSVVSLREITKDTARTILRLDVASHQKRFVASNAVSIAQAYFEEKAWLRAIYADETPVGFLMLYDDPDEPQYFLWRFMIDARFQKHGFGRQAMARLFAHVRTLPGAKELLVSHTEGEGNPGDFYRKLGFEYTGEIMEGERVMKRAL
jgi:diamine N-acetyltransferase